MALDDQIEQELLKRTYKSGDKIPASLATSANLFLVSSKASTWVVKTIAQIKAILLDETVPYIGATTDVDLGTHKIAAGNSAIGDGTNQCVVEPDGTLRLDGNATGYDDIDFPLIPKTTGAGSPSYVTIVGNLTAMAFAVNDALPLEPAEQKHKIKVASTATWHVHIVTRSNDGTNRGIKVELEYSNANVLPAGGVTAFSASTVISAEYTVPAGTPVGSHVILDIATFATLKPGAHTLCRIKRIASVGVAPSVDPCIIKVQYHAENDTPAGSRTVINK